MVANSAGVVLCVGTSHYSAQNLKLSLFTFWYWNFFQTTCNGYTKTSLKSLTGISSFIFIIAELIQFIILLINILLSNQKLFHHYWVFDFVHLYSEEYSVLETLRISVFRLEGGNEYLLWSVRKSRPQSLGNNSPIINQLKLYKI